MCHFLACSDPRVRHRDGKPTYTDHKEGRRKTNHLIWMKPPTLQPPTQLESMDVLHLAYLISPLHSLPPTSPSRRQIHRAVFPSSSSDKTPFPCTDSSTTGPWNGCGMCTVTHS
ncbi:hypothetical protein SCLCIDRAFT_1224450 [Scleroderma citrinum Foug A]|uniref:Uncharacterized protein n=1 Tax=Scleroderma citrinum Foug A TaxID=1036808 RepID=A0A0C3CSF7_9AGAM|nr:hypothetical protein SCLCIDRAFT_1224450 [Scleroderma citrinum Foug A]